MGDEYNLQFPRYHGAPPASGTIRSQPEDFQVDELLGFQPGGEGEHVYLQIRKRGENTLWLVKQLARFAGVRPMDIGYAGLKDRNALTSQWFSVWLPGNVEPDWQQLSGNTVEVLQAVRHHRKLKRGGHAGNRFHLRIRQLGASAELDVRLQALLERGVPNYFGEQRFGHHGGNLDQAEALFRGRIRVRDRQRRGLYLSAARSYLFNLVVAERVRRQGFDRYLNGDRLMIDGTTNLATVDDASEIEQRLQRLELHPTGPLCGRGRTLLEADSLALEAAILAPFAHWTEGLERAGLSSERRAVRVRLAALSWRFEQADVLALQFDLPPGTYATSVLRECCDYQVAPSPSYHPD